MNLNYILCPVRNNLHLTRKAIKTLVAQDIGNVQIVVINNASTDGTSEFLQTQKQIAQMYFAPPMSVAASWNWGLKYCFRMGAEYVLVVNNDVELRPDTYRLLVADGGGFVTAIGTRDATKIQPPYNVPDKNAVKRPHPDFSCYLIRREIYEKVGKFDEEFGIAFCEDGDYDLRLYKAGVRAYCLDLPFLHHGSMTIKNAEPKEIAKIQAQADKNREYFRRKWGFAMASEEYYKVLDKGGPS
jgi:O-antigen biosynthesis protein